MSNEILALTYNRVPLRCPVVGKILITHTFIEQVICIMNILTGHGSQ